MKIGATAAALVVCILPGSAQALLGGTRSLTSKPGVTGEEHLALRSRALIGADCAAAAQRRADR